MKTNHEFPFIQPGDVFVLRVGSTGPAIWQRKEGSSALLFNIPPPFNDAFGVSQEWEFNTQTQEQALRLDFMFRLTQAPSTRFESVPYHVNLRSALSGCLDGQVTRELQRSYEVHHIFSDAESSAILDQLDFNRDIHHPDHHWTTFLERVNPENAPVARIEVAELLDTLDQYSSQEISATALSQLQDLRYRRRQRINPGTYLFFPRKMSYHLLVFRVFSLSNPWTFNGHHQFYKRCSNPVQCYKHSPGESKPILPHG